ncbi:Rrf2 family transcriptional regulator [Pseudoruminococcus massiliensis]|uniref:Rrf2 family transcriptional regulator n=1 Tax=Pseudoruminococcus massiliensis TaxID=2086583 RepID=UPI003992AF7B
MKVPMKVPMKVQLGIMAMIDIATNSQGGRVVTTTSISKSQNISPKYLEQILPALRLAMLIRSQKGSNGGYIITKPCNQITLKDIINALDPNILSDVYFDTNNKNSTMIDTINDDLWNNMTSYLQDYTEKITLKDICDDYRQRLDNQEAQFMYYI